jgi:hypothetical protein
MVLTCQNRGVILIVSQSIGQRKKWSSRGKKKIRRKGKSTERSREERG